MPLQLHDRVRKTKGDYLFEGEVISCLVKRGGAVRYVVEDDRGLLLILNETQLEKVEQTTEAK